MWGSAAGTGGAGAADTDDAAGLDAGTGLAADADGAAGELSVDDDGVTGVGADEMGGGFDPVVQALSPKPAAITTAATRHPVVCTRSVCPVDPTLPESGGRKGANTLDDRDGVVTVHDIQVVGSGRRKQDAEGT